MDWTMWEVNTEEDTQWDPRELGSLQAEEPVGSRQWALLWLKATPIVKTLWIADREGPPDSGYQRCVSSQPESGSPSPSTPEPVIIGGEATARETGTPLEVCP
ncbi:UNVERIFIED_CONTAM: hypothetical protein FKN15_039688 [Acipenser sinensis]